MNGQTWVDSVCCTEISGEKTFALKTICHGWLELSLLLMLNTPVSIPTEDGMNCMINGMESPGEILSGKDMFGRENEPFPFWLTIPTDETINVRVPILWTYNVSDCAPLHSNDESDCTCEE